MPSNDSLPRNSGKSEPPAKREAVELSGIGVSGGIVIGSILRIHKRRREVPEVVLPPEQVDPEVRRFREAVDRARRQIEHIREQASNMLGEDDAQIFDAHLLLIGDPAFLDEVIDGIRKRRRNAEFVFWEIARRYVESLARLEDPYLRERSGDILDVADRVLANLAGDPGIELSELPEPCVLAAYDLSPSDTVSMDRVNVLAFVTVLGSRTSHTAIMARALGVPAVVGVARLLEFAETGDEVIVDGDRGRVILRPDPAAKARYRRILTQKERWAAAVAKVLPLPAETLDGFQVRIAANVELPEEVRRVHDEYGTDIGLFRTEFLFINRPTLPSEDDQFAVYRKAAEDTLPRSVIFRTLDIGGDKFLSSVPVAEELNPFLGLRAVRFCLANPEVFRSQVRAILRASAFGKVRILFPMISTFDELEQVLELLDETKADLDRAGIPYNKNLDVGIMIEVPSAALIADRLAPRVDFFSIGTNDLVQYSLAVDRGNPGIAYLYQPTHPAVVQLIRRVLEAAWSHGKWVSMCGEMAGDPILVPLVLGLGIHEISMSPVAIGPVKALIRRLRLHQAEKIANAALNGTSAREITEMCQSLVASVAPELLAPGKNR